MTPKPHRIMLVEDDESLGYLIQDNLKTEGYQVDLYPDGGKALTAFANSTFDLCILDVMMPVMDGFTLAQKIRVQNKEVPMIFLTARNQLDDRIKGFGLGADDYVCKPFSIEEFKMRVAAIIKRSGNGHQPMNNEMLLGSLLFKPQEKNILHNGAIIKLTNKEAKILKILLENMGHVVERDDLLNSIWQDDGYFTGRSMDVFISHLRKKLSVDPSIKITNIHGVGFKLGVE